MLFFEMWQDFVFGAGGIVLGILLLPTLLDTSSSISRKTSIPTFLVLLLFSFTFFTLDLYISAIAHLFSGILWMAIALWRPIPEETLFGIKLSSSKN